MSAYYIPYPKTGYFSDTICDYLQQKKDLKPFYNRFPTLDSLGDQIAEKQASGQMSPARRSELYKAILTCYGALKLSDKSEANLSALKEDNTFTITTGHQLNLFTGPLYFLYKIISVINFCKQANAAYPEYNFVPVYWMATEDHDFEEINYFNFKGSKIQWNRTEGGAVGDLTNSGLDEVLKVFKAATGITINAKQLQLWFEKAYLEQANLAEATRFLANEIFGEQGLIIVDGHDRALKKAFVPYVKKELLDQSGFKAISETTQRLVAAGYKEQVHPREINLFYLERGLRERIVKDGELFRINNSDKTFSTRQILALADEEPERFSPNALLRPLYQEVILPNLCYIGGGGELAYWLQLKDYFKKVGVTFPMLMLRNSVLLISEKQAKKVAKLDLELADMFKKSNALTDFLVEKHSELPLDFQAQKDHLKEQFIGLYKLAEQTDASFVGAVAAQEKKQINGLNRLEKRLKRAEKRNNKDRIARVLELQTQLFPGQSLQERSTNFSEFYLEYGSALLKALSDELDPFRSEFLVLHL